MRRRRIILGSALAVGLVALALLWPRGPSEPVYQGKRLSKWIEETDRVDPSWIEKTRREPEFTSLKAVRAIGTNALPWLLSEFGTPDSTWRMTVNRWVSQVRRRNPGPTKEAQRRYRAYEGFCLLGPVAAPALPALYDRLMVEGRTDSAGAAMVGIGEPAIPYLLRGMASTNAIIEYLSCKRMEQLAQTVPAAVPHIIALLQHTDRNIGYDAVVSLCNSLPHPELRIPALRAAMSDSNQAIVMLATRAINNARGGSNNILPELRLLLLSTNAATALAASNALFILEHPARP